MCLSRNSFDRYTEGKNVCDLKIVELKDKFNFIFKTFWKNYLELMNFVSSLTEFCKKKFLKFKYFFLPCQQVWCSDAKIFSCDHTFVLNSLKSLRRDTDQTRISSTHWYSTLQSLQIKSTLSRHIFRNYSLLSLHSNVFLKRRRHLRKVNVTSVANARDTFRDENVDNFNWCIKFKLFVTECPVVEINEAKRCETI